MSLRANGKSMSHLRQVVRRSLVFLALLALLALPVRGLDAQQSDAEKKEAAALIARGDSARATWVQPPGNKGVSLAGVMRSPFKFFALGIGAVAGVGYLGYVAGSSSGMRPGGWRCWPGGAA